MTISLSWTDQCLLIVLGVSSLVILLSLRKKHVRQSFSRIFRKPLAVSSGVILLFFLLIALLDSIHVTHSTGSNTTQAISLLDRWLTPLNSLYEKTYSAPMALTLYSAETVLINGKMQQIIPRLQYPNSRFTNSHEVMQFAFKVILKASFAALAVTIIIVLVMIVLRRTLKGDFQVKYNSCSLAGLTTIFMCLTIALSCFWLSKDFHVLGTGKIGQDIFFYAVKSIRTGLIIGILTTLFMLPVALILGIAAGYFGGLVDDVIQYIYTTLSSIPGVLLITASVLSLQTFIANHPDQFKTLAENADARLLALCLILGVTSWTSLCRLLRAETMKLREIDYVLAARALGTSAFKIMRKHILPNVMHIIVITLVLDFSFLVLAEAVLAYVGVGVSPMTISWGNMINAARLELARDPVVWWPMSAAFIFMFILVLASNIFADAVQDAFDPKQSDNH